MPDQAFATVAQQGAEQQSDLSVGVTGLASMRGLRIYGARQEAGSGRSTIIQGRGMRSVGRWSFSVHHGTRLGCNSSGGGEDAHSTEAFSVDPAYSIRAQGARRGRRTDDARTTSDHRHGAMTEALAGPSQALRRMKVGMTRKRPFHGGGESARDPSTILIWDIG